MFSSAVRREIGDIGRWETILDDFACHTAQHARHPELYANDLRRRVGRYIAFCRRLRRDPTKHDTELVDTFLRTLLTLRYPRVPVADTTRRMIGTYIKTWHDWWTSS